MRYSENHIFRKGDVMFHVERELKVNDNPFYDNVSRFEDYKQAADYFNSIEPKPGERWWLEYSSEINAEMLACKGDKLVYS